MPFKNPFPVTLCCEWSPGCLALILNLASSSDQRRQRRKGILELGRNVLCRVASCDRVSCGSVLEISSMEMFEENFCECQGVSRETGIVLRSR